MIFTETPLKGAFVIDLEKRGDERGFFARAFCMNEFAEHGLVNRIAQANLSHNPLRGTLRGMHYQVPPHREAKLVRCTMGAIHDVIIDLRPASSAYKQHVAVLLTAENRRMLYIPEGMAHGFQTLVDDTEVFYQISEFYSPEHARGVRWDDPAFAIAWPPDDRIINDRDRGYSDFTDA